jgi:hypothetical protein
LIEAFQRHDPVIVGIFHWRTIETGTGPKLRGHRQKVEYTAGRRKLTEVRVGGRRKMIIWMIILMIISMIGVDAVIGNDEDGLGNYYLSLR